MGAKGYRWTPTHVGWTLIDDSHPRFNRYRCNAGYVEAFMKYEDPYKVKPFGNTNPITEEEYDRHMKRSQAASEGHANKKASVAAKKAHYGILDDIIHTVRG